MYQSPGALDPNAYRAIFFEETQDQQKIFDMKSGLPNEHGLTDKLAVIGVVLGLVVGKPIGVLLGSWAVTLSTFLMSSPLRGGLNFSTHEVGWIYSTFAFGGMAAVLDVTHGLPLPVSMAIV